MEVLAIISRTSARTLANFDRQFRTSFSVLGDPTYKIRGSRYQLRGNPTVIIIDKEGITRYAGRFTTWQKMKEEIEVIRSGA